LRGWVDRGECFGAGDVLAVDQVLDVLHRKEWPTKPQKITDPNAQNTVRLSSIICAMAKDKTQYTCTECGGTSPKWLGKCPSCNAWNTLIEGAVESGGQVKNRYAGMAALVPAAEVATLSDIEASEVPAHPPAKKSLTAFWAVAWLKAAWS
jgi:hypothetical protein